MPQFLYSLTYGTETKTVELRKSNPQGWLLQAVETSFPEVASRRAEDIMRLRLEKAVGRKQAWQASLIDGAHDLIIQVSQV
ncbi:hypothetical protein RA19_20750 [Leisingera sp. ANG-M1]|uniref:hypothetical protein n=1 Tax=Leisingera sp. ANG-M1 TaxID=1577895 RepID=UPI0005806C66|nr:hypothetical protein [Leisingera sp. ANG-M1]KIC08398.1 hypothetical protein RA19_20750 [Leisingera sp. ANG-M1]